MKKFNEILSLKWVLMLVIALTGAMTMTSCSDDEDEPKTYTGSELKEKLQGTWRIYEVTVDAFGQKITCSADEIYDMLGRLGADEYIDDVLKFSDNKVNGMTYKVKGDKLYLPWYGDDMPMKVSFKGNNLILDVTVEVEGFKMKEQLVYKKVSSKASNDIDMNGTGLSIGKVLPTLVK